MAVAARVVSGALVGALIALFEVATQGRGAAQFDRGHDATLSGGQRRVIFLAIDCSVAAKNVRYFQCWSWHGMAQGCVWAGAGCSCSGGWESSEEGSRSNGLTAARTVLAASFRYRAVVFRLRCPSSNWMVRRSVPASSK